MTHLDRRGLQSAAGIRIAARRNPGLGIRHLLSEVYGKDRAAHAPPRSLKDLGLTTWADLLPWSLNRPRPMNRTVLLSLTVPLALLFQVVGWHLALVLGTLAAGGVGLWREFRSPQRRASKILEGVELEIQSGRPLESVHERLESALNADPDNDGARFLLACLLFEEGGFLSALLQLAPLRDHHPTVGEIVLLAAASYSNLDLHEDTIGMLDTLDIDAAHPSLPAAASMLWRAQLGTGQRLDDPPDSGRPRHSSHMLS